MNLLFLLGISVGKIHPQHVKQGFFEFQNQAVEDLREFSRWGFGIVRASHEQKGHILKTLIRRSKEELAPSLDSSTVSSRTDKPCSSILEVLKSDTKILFQVFPRCVYPVALLGEHDIEFLQMLLVHHIKFSPNNDITFPLLVLEIIDWSRAIQTEVDNAIVIIRCSKFVSLFLRNTGLTMLENVLKALSGSKQSIQLFLNWLLIESNFLQFMWIHERKKPKALSLLLSLHDPDLFQWIEHYYPRSDSISKYRSECITQFEGFKNSTYREQILKDNDGRSARLFFYILRSIIRLEINQIHANWFVQIASSSSIKGLFHTVVTPRIPDELLRVAIAEGNDWVIQYLLAIPAVYDSANHSLLVMDDRPSGASASNRESSMETLTLLEESCFSTFLRTYKEQCTTTTRLDDVWEQLRTHLAQHFEEECNLSVKNSKGYPLRLPLEWDELYLEGDLRKQALEQYYQCPIHTAWRYLAPDNPWLHPQSPYVQRRGDGKQVADSQAVLKETITLMYLGLMDDTALDEGYTLEERIMLFFIELAAINRAHNCDEGRDDLEGDKPSCSAGVKRRLVQCIRGHPKLKVLTKERLLMKVKQLVQVHWKECFARMKNDALLHLENHIVPVLLCLRDGDFTDDDHAVISQFNVSEEKIETWCHEVAEDLITRIVMTSFLKKRLKHDTNDLRNCHLSYFSDLLTHFGVKISTNKQSGTDM
jgi:hypothetical protein